MYKFISPTGEIVKTKSVKEFAIKNNIPYEAAKRLSSGTTGVAYGWCSTHPKAKKKKERFLTKFVNIETGEQHQIGESFNAIINKHKLNHRNLTKLVKGQITCYKNWVLDKTYEAMCSQNIISSPAVNI